MEIHININKDLSEDTVNFSIKEMTPELSQIINNLQNLNFKIVANRSGKNYQLDFNDIVTIYSENKKIIVFTEDKQQYFLNGSLKN
ncbi:LytTR family transcriptional regulator, partial [Enterococcus faecalis]